LKLILMSDRVNAEMRNEVASISRSAERGTLATSTPARSGPATLAPE